MSDDFKGRGGSPWGTPPGGGNGSGKGPTPPDIDAIIRDIQNKINKFLPGGSKSGGKPIGLILIIYFSYGLQVDYIEWDLMNKVLYLDLVSL